MLAGDGISARVVSMPSFELFRAQERSYRDEVLPPSIDGAGRRGGGEPLRLGASGSASTGAVVAIDRFGASAPGPEALAALGITPRGRRGGRDRAQVGGA